VQFGLFSNGARHNQIAKVSYQDDLNEVMLADELGIQEAWISEHGTLVNFQAPDQMPSADLFICKAAALTKQIRMGAGIRALPDYHPLQVATDAATCDHLTDGRYMAGWGVGLGIGLQPQRGKLPGEPRAMVKESIDLILKAWAAPEPFDWNGEFWQGREWHIIPQPLTKPHPEVGIACARTEGTLELTAQNGFYPLMAYTGGSDRFREMVDTYLRAGESAPLPARRGRVRIARVVYVADSVEQAMKDLKGADLGSALVAGRLDEYIPPGGTRDDLTMEYLIERGVFFGGDPNTVYDQIKSFYDEVGGFGVLMLVVGKDWGTWEQRARSMRRFMEEVAPRLAALDPDRVAVA
jgi:alkanesulfonate monooxygenase SsuD/methylene tetrahydromethanopterin reductase-like flavin-dependent oxidoreductase (luciferase family)